MDALLTPSSGEPDATTTRRSEAFQVWVEQLYGHIFEQGEGGGPRIPVLAAREFMAAMRAGRVPDWAVSLAPLQQIRAAAKGGD